MVLYAEQELIARKGALIFGFPNAAAYPTWTKELHYRETGLTRWRSPTLALTDAIRISRDRWPQLPIPVAQDDKELIDCKRRVHGKSLVVARNSSGLLWGVRQRQPVGPLSVAFLHIGGFRFDSRDGFVTAYREALGAAGRPPIARFEAAARNPFLAPFKGTQVQRAVSSKAIHKALDVNDKDIGDSLGLFAGIKDTF